LLGALWLADGLAEAIAFPLARFLVPRLLGAFGLAHWIAPTITRLRVEVLAGVAFESTPAIAHPLALFRIPYLDRAFLFADGLAEAIAHPLALFRIPLLLGAFWFANGLALAVANPLTFNRIPFLLGAFGLAVGLAEATAYPRTTLIVPFLFRALWLGCRYALAPPLTYFVPEPLAFETWPRRIWPFGAFVGLAIHFARLFAKPGTALVIGQKLDRRVIRDRSRGLPLYRIALDLAHAAVFVFRHL
jgi:hypothetical protein